MDQIPTLQERKEKIETKSPFMYLINELLSLLNLREKLVNLLHLFVCLFFPEASRKAIDSVCM